MNERRKFVVVGTGSRGIGMWVQPMLERYRDEVEPVGLYDINPGRARACNKILNSSIPVYESFDEMLRTSGADSMVVASADATHAEYVVRGIEAGLSVYCEKPLCTTLNQVHTIRAVAARAKHPVVVTHNARCQPCAEVMRHEMMAGRIGEPKHVLFTEVLDRFHGADYFRRWHRRFANSGGLLLQKASHHFDMINWMVQSRARTVAAQGGLFFYGKNGPFRGKRCSECSHSGECPLYADVFRNSYMSTLYREVEHLDGYFRDQCVFGEEIDIHDTMNVTIAYENGVQASYSLIAYASYEGMHFAIEGTKGRFEWQAKYNTVWAVGREKEQEHKASLEQSGRHDEQMVFCDPEHRMSDLTPTAKDGSHGGADPIILQFVFSRQPPPDPMGQRASLEDGIQAVLIGIAANKSMELGGRPVAVQTGEPV